MPMDFPDMESLKFAARVHKFRDILPGESEVQYRNALADHVFAIDHIESEEIRNGIGWDKWNDDQKKMALSRGLLKKVDDA